jgi:hypothetical protein
MKSGGEAGWCHSFGFVLEALCILRVSVVNLKKTHHGTENTEKLKTSQTMTPTEAGKDEFEYRL